MTLYYKTKGLCGTLNITVKRFSKIIRVTVIYYN